MITQKLLTDAENYNKSILTASEILKDGGVVGIPTETVYGLAASAYDGEAINKIFLAKGRPQDNPLIVHISDMEMLYDIAIDIPAKALECAKRFWPGPLTMIFKKGEKIANEVSAGLDTVAVRMPSHKTALDIIKSSGLPLAAPSANLSGKPSPTSASHVEADLDGKIDAIVFDEECSVGVESTVVSFCCNPPRILRPGAVIVEELREIIPEIEVDKAVLEQLEENTKVESPGLKYKHYAPKTECYLVEGSSESFINFVNNKISSVAICFEEEKDFISGEKIVCGTFKNFSTVAQRLFSALREIDSLGKNVAYIHAPSKDGIGLAVYNRLLRACGFKVINLNAIIGLTGPTGAGKSILSSVAKEFGFQIIDCDKTARVAVERGTDGLKALVKVFGVDILNEDNTLNRKALAQKAFACAENTKLLNKTILPFITKLVKEEIKSDKVLLDAPTLFESGMNSICTMTVAVLADTETRLNRIMQRDNMDKESAMLRINAGKTDDFYKQNADFIIYNNDNKENAICEFKKIIAKTQGKI